MTSHLRELYSLSKNMTKRKWVENMTSLMNPTPWLNALYLLSITTVYFHMFLYVRQMTELLQANIAAVLLLTRVSPHMGL